MLTPETIKQIEQEAESQYPFTSGIAGAMFNEKASVARKVYISVATAFATKLSQAEEENKRLRKSLEAMKSIIEQDLIANGNNDLGNRLHIEICVGLKQQP